MGEPGNRNRSRLAAFSIGMASRAYLQSTATFSACGQYRYRLSRVWDDDLPRVLWILLNPSLADADADDPTVRRCVAFARSWGFGGIEIANLFALRSSDPKVLRSHPEPIGPENDTHLLAAANDRKTTRIVCGWGTRGVLRGRDAAVQALLAAQTKLHTLDLTANGSPKHPLYILGTCKPQPFN